MQALSVTWVLAQTQTCLTEEFTVGSRIITVCCLFTDILCVLNHTFVWCHNCEQVITVLKSSMLPLHSHVIWLQHAASHEGVMWPSAALPSRPSFSHSKHNEASISSVWVYYSPLHPVLKVTTMLFYAALRRFTVVGLLASLICPALSCIYFNYCGNWLKMQPQPFIWKQRFSIGKLWNICNWSSSED